MDKATENKIKEQQEKLKQLQQKDLPDKAKKAIQQKINGTNEAFNK